MPVTKLERLASDTADRAASKVETLTLSNLRFPETNCFKRENGSLLRHITMENSDNLPDFFCDANQAFDHLETVILKDDQTRTMVQQTLAYQIPGTFGKTHANRLLAHVLLVPRYYRVRYVPESPDNPPQDLFTPQEMVENRSLFSKHLYNKVQSKKDMTIHYDVPDNQGTMKNMKLTVPVDKQRPIVIEPDDNTQ